MRLKVDVSDGRDVFFISDLHFFHKNVIKFDERPFLDDQGNPDVDLMHETIINNWNSVVKSNDIVFYLGDLSFTSLDRTIPLVKRLNGQIHFIMGNHDDYRDIKAYNRFLSINDLVDLTIINNNVKNQFVLCHYPIFSWNKQSHGNFHIHGHCHHNLHHGDTSSYYVDNRVMDVGCNGIDYTPHLL